MTHEQKMQEQFPDYPCAKCNKKETVVCNYRECYKFVSWFSAKWKQFRETAQRIRENKEQRTVKGTQEYLQDICKIIESAESERERE